MPKASKETATSKIIDTPESETRYADLGEYIVGFGHCKKYIDFRPALKESQSDGLCPTPHWGYVISGRLTYHYADHTEIYEAGDAWYAPAGHTAECDAGLVGLYFSPKPADWDKESPAVESDKADDVD